MSPTCVEEDNQGSNPAIQEKLEAIINRCCQKKKQIWPCGRSGDVADVLHPLNKHAPKVERSEIDWPTADRVPITPVNLLKGGGGNMYGAVRLFNCVGVVLTSRVGDGSSHGLCEYGAASKVLVRLRRSTILPFPPPPLPSPALLTSSGASFIGRAGANNRESKPARYCLQAPERRQQARAVDRCCNGRRFHCQGQRKLHHGSDVSSPKYVLRRRRRRKKSTS